MTEDQGQGRHSTARDGESTAAIARNAFYLLLGQVGTTALAIVMSAALARSLGATDFGIYFLVASMSTFAYVFVEWGQQLFVIREVAKRPARAGDLLGTALVTRIASAALVSVPAGLLAWALGYEARTCWFSALFIGASLPFFLAQGYGMVFRARDRMGRDATVSVSNKALALAIALPMLALGAGIPGVMLAQAVAGLAALAVAASLYKRIDGPPLRVASSTARELFVGGAPIVAMTVAVAAQPYLDAIILSKLAPANAVGWFGAAKNVLGTLLAPASILGAAAYPRLSRVAADPLALAREVRVALRPLLWLGALGAAGTYLFADKAIAVIYGASGFGPAGTILRVFAPGLFLLFIDVLLGNIILATGRAKGFATAKVVSVLVSTGLDVLLIPFFQRRAGNGGIGVVVAFAVSELAVFAGALLIMPRGTLKPAAAVDVGRAVATAAATLLLFRVIPPVPIYVGIPLCIFVFGLFSAALGLANRGDLEVLQSLLRRRKPAPSPAGSGS